MTRNRLSDLNDAPPRGNHAHSPPSQERRFYARSASDRTDDWPFWFVADGQRGGMNVTAEVSDRLGIPRRKGAALGAPWDMAQLAMRANRDLTP